jgi:hypothetical protein
MAAEGLFSYSDSALLSLKPVGLLNMKVLNVLAFS